MECATARHVPKLGGRYFRVVALADWFTITRPSSETLTQWIAQELAALWQRPSHRLSGRSGEHRLSVSHAQQRLVSRREHDRRTSGTHRIVGAHRPDGDARSAAANHQPIGQPACATSLWRVGGMARSQRRHRGIGMGAPVAPTAAVRAHALLLHVSRRCSGARYQRVTALGTVGHRSAHADSIVPWSHVKQPTHNTATRSARPTTRVRSATPMNQARSRMSALT